MPSADHTDSLHEELNGTWSATLPDDELRRAYPDVQHDDSGWEQLEVPGLWRSNPAFADAESVLYRRRFHRADAGPGRRTWLGFEGLCYQGDVWMDGSYLGDTEGYFAPHLFEITDQCRERDDHVVALELTCRNPGDRTQKRNLTGVLQHWDQFDQDQNPGGIWRKVWVEDTGPIRITSLRVTVVEADAERAIVAFDAVLDSVATHTVELRTYVDPAQDQPGEGRLATVVEEHVLSAGENRLEWRVAVDEPDLWWPVGLGEPTLHDIRVDAVLAGAVSHTRKRRLGFRGIELRNWIASINGERLHLKGVNVGPIRADLSAITDDDVEVTLERVVELGLNTIRVHGHVAPPQLYRAADRLGVLVWQDFPLQWGYARGVRAAAERQAVQMVDLLAHHPSIVVWCGHNEPVPLDVRPGHRPDAEPANRFLRRGALQQGLPSWNRTVLDRGVRRAIRGADASRPAIPHSGVLPHPPQLDGTDGHHYFGWYQGEARGLEDLAVRVPRMIRFVSEFGAQAMPDLGTLGLAHLRDAPIESVDWEDLRDRLGLQFDIATTHVPLEGHETLGSWAAATRAHQADVVRQNVETLRRLKYRPNGGFCHFHLSAPDPMVTFALFDAAGVAQPAAEALRHASQPVLPVADRLADVTLSGTPIRQRLHVVSDRRETIDDARLDVVLASSAGERHWRFDGPIPADSVVKVGEVRWHLPATAGRATVTLRLTAADVDVTNTYSTTVVGRRPIGRTG